MKPNYLTLFFSLICATVFFACTKHRGDVEERVPVATLTFASPTEGTVYKTGDSVLIQGLAIATDVMHGCDVSIKNAADTSVVYYREHLHEHNDTIAINHKWKNTITTATSLQVEVTLILDHDGHTSTKTVGIKTVN